MNIREEVKNKILGFGKGTFHTIVTERRCKTYKNVEDIIIKKMRATSLTFGVGYDNKKSTIEGRENGTLPPENAGLKGREWTLYPYFMVGKSGNELVRTNITKNTVFVTEYFKNGEPVSFDDIKELLVSSEKRPKDKDLTTMDLNLDTIIELV